MLRFYILTQTLSHQRIWDFCLRLQSFLRQRIWDLCPRLRSSWTTTSRIRSQKSIRLNPVPTINMRPRVFPRFRPLRMVAHSMSIQQRILRLFSRRGPSPARLSGGTYPDLVFQTKDDVLAAYVSKVSKVLLTAGAFVIAANLIRSVMLDECRVRILGPRPRSCKALSNNNLDFKLSSHRSLIHRVLSR
jgi:hypothetical protein